MVKTNNMSKPIIILGAGASHDYSAYAETRPPLTNDLLKPKFLDKNALSNNYKEAADLLTVMSDSILSGEKSFEEKLIDIKNEVGSLSNIKSQFVSLEFYLQKVFRDISNKVQHPLNNYKTLVQKINYYNGGKAHIVSFNYDTLFESSIGINLWQTVKSYIENNLKLIKVHGSHDWIYIQSKSLVSAFDADLDNYDFYLKNPDYLNNIRSMQDINPYPIAYIEKQKDEGERFIRFPAIAIPLPDKSDFICPQTHMLELESALKIADRVLIIGWKAGDKPFLDYMKKYLSKEVPVTVVSSSKRSAEEIISSKLSDFSCRAADNQGFSAFISSDDIKQFFM